MSHRHAQIPAKPSLVQNPTIDIWEYIMNDEYLDWENVCPYCKYFMNTSTMQKCMWFPVNRDVDELYECPIERKSYP